MSIRIKQGDKWVEVKVPVITDTTLTKKGQAADAEKVGEFLTNMHNRLDNLALMLETNDQDLVEIKEIAENLPVKVSPDGFTDVLNARLPVDISVKEINGYIDGSSDVEITMILEGQKTVKAAISFDNEDRPIALQSSTNLCPISWIVEKIPTTDADISEEETATYAFQNGSINTTEFGPFKKILVNGYGGTATCDVFRPSGQNFLEFSGGDKMQAGDISFGNYNTIGFEFESPFDLTDYYTLVVEVNEMSYAPFYLMTKDVNEQEYSSLAVLDSDSATNYEIEKDITDITGEKILRFEARTNNTTGTDRLRITNLYFIGTPVPTASEFLYFIGPNGRDEIFGTLFGHRYVVNNTNFALRWPSGQDGDYRNPDKTGGALPWLSNTNSVDLSAYKSMKINTSLGQGYVKTLNVAFIDESGEVVATKEIAIGENNYDIQEIVQNSGPLSLKFSADLTAMGTSVYFTEVSFSKQAIE